MPKYALALTLMVSFATSALADFYVVQNTADKTCSIVDAKDKPAMDDTTMVVVGTKNYQTMEEAEAQLKSEKACQPQ